MDITEFLIACLDEEQADAERLPPHPWKVGDEYSLVLADDDIEVATSFALSNNQMIRTRDHIVRYGPDRVLREVAAKRELLEWCIEVTKHVDWTTVGQDGSLLNDPNPRATHTAILALKTMAAPYVDRPGYKEEWKL